MEDNFIVDMSQLHLSKEDRVIVKTAEKALRELDFTSFRVWLSLVASNGYNPQQIMADYNFTMEQVTHSMEKLEKKGYITPVGEDALIIRHFPEKKEKVILSRNVAASLLTADILFCVKKQIVATLRARFISSRGAKRLKPTYLLFLLNARNTIISNRARRRNRTYGTL